MVVVYIYPGPFSDCEWDTNGDPFLTPTGRTKTEELAYYLYARVGPPVFIVLSSFYYIREASDIITNKIFELSGISPERYIDKDIIDYMGENRDSKGIRLRADTEQYGLHFPDNYTLYNARIREHASFSQKLCKENDIYWIIASGGVISRVLNCMNLYVPGKIPNGGAIIIDRDGASFYNGVREEKL